MAKKPATMSQTEIDEATAAAQTIENRPVHSRAELLAKAVNYMAGMKPDDLSDFFYASIERKEAQPLGNEAGHNADTLSTHPSAASPQVHEALKQDLTSLFEGQEVSPEFLEKATLLFEAAVSGRVAVLRAEIQEEVEAEAETRFEEVVSDLSEKIDGYASYAAQEWLEENRVAVDNSVKAELALSFAEGLQALFTEHNFKIADDQVDVVEALTAKVEALEEKLTGAIDDVVETSRQLAAATMREAFAECSKGLTDMQVEKFKGMSETVSFEGDLEDFKTKLLTIREVNFKDVKAPVKSTGLTEETVTVELVTGSDESVEKKPVDPSVAGLVGMLDRMQRT